MTTFTESDKTLVIEALKKAAARFESQARSNPAGKRASEHETKAKRMRELRAKLMNGE